MMVGLKSVAAVVPLKLLKVDSVRAHFEKAAFHALLGPVDCWAWRLIRKGEVIAYGANDEEILAPEDMAELVAHEGPP